MSIRCMRSRDENRDRVGHGTYAEIFSSATEYVNTLSERLARPAFTLPQDRAIRRIVSNREADFEDGGEINLSWHYASCDCKRKFHTDREHPFESWAESKWSIINGTDDDVEAMGLNQPIVLDERPHRKLVRDYAGAFACVPASLGGSMKTMYRPVKVSMPTKTATFIILTNAGCMTSSRALRDAARKNMAKVMDAERNGIRTNVYAGSLSSAYSSQFRKAGEYDQLLLVKVKDSSSVFSPKRLSWSLASAGFFRVYGFNWMATQPECPTLEDYGYSVPERCVYGGDFKKQLREMAPSFFDSLGNYTVMSTMETLNGKEY